MPANLNEFNIELECHHKGEYYSVRDNGAVLRHPKEGKLPRHLDNKWTFGIVNNKTGYLEIASIRIHRIVAFSFHGEPPTKEHVVDHIDTNRQNNRPENLRWVTKLENILLNPITVKRIEAACKCSIEDFLADPSKYRDKFQEPNYTWMCNVSIEEAQKSKENLLEWANCDKRFNGGSLGEWIYNRSKLKQNFEDRFEHTTSLTPKAIQKNWTTPSEFPYCPNETNERPIYSYFKNLNIGDTYSKNQYENWRILDLSMSTDETVLWILGESSNVNAIKLWALAEITFDGKFFIHSSKGSFFQKIGAEKYFTVAQGKGWTGGDVFDDFC